MSDAAIVARVLREHAKTQFADPETDDMTVSLAVELAEVHAQLAAARSALEEVFSILEADGYLPEAARIAAILSTLAQEPAGQSEAEADADASGVDRERITAAIRDYCNRDLSTVAISSDGIERIYYSGLSLPGLVDAILAILPAGSASPGATEPVQVVPADLSELTAQRDALNGDVHELGQRVEALEDALKNARSMLTAFGGDPRKVIAEHGSAAGDEIQAALLDQIDAALAAHPTVKVSGDAAEWQPIATAPKEGGYLVKNEVGQVAFCDIQAGHRIIHNVVGFIEWDWNKPATHWRYLPRALPLTPEGR